MRMSGLACRRGAGRCAVHLRMFPCDARDTSKKRADSTRHVPAGIRGRQAVPAPVAVRLPVPGRAGGGGTAPLPRLLSLRGRPRRHPLEHPSARRAAFRQAGVERSCPTTRVATCSPTRGPACWTATPGSAGTSSTPGDRGTSSVRQAVRHRCAHLITTEASSTPRRRLRPRHAPERHLGRDAPRESSRAFDVRRGGPAARSER